MRHPFFMTRSFGRIYHFSRKWWKWYIKTHFCSPFLQKFRILVYMKEEWTGQSGFGLLLNRTYPMSTPDHPVSGSEWISFDLSSLILTLVICLILFSIVFFIIFKVKSADRIRELEHSDEEWNKRFLRVLNKLKEVALLDNLFYLANQLIRITSCTS